MSKTGLLFPILGIAFPLAFISGCCRQYLSSEDVINPKFATREEKVAPLFKHGTGFGYYRRYFLRSERPVYCYEDRAIALIIAELEQVGIEVDMINVRIEEIKGFRKTRFLVLLYEKFSACDRWVLDGYCSGLNIGFEFVSIKDAPDLEATGGMGEDWGYNLAGAAEKVRGWFQEYDQMTIGVFYDPVFMLDKWLWEDDDELDMLYAMISGYLAEQLHLQVQDFISWLRQEGYLGPEDGGGE